MEVLKQVEFYLESKSKRERFLLNLLCLVVGFFIVFSLCFEALRVGLLEKEKEKILLQEEFFSLKKLRDSQENSKIQDETTLQQSLLELEQKISLQEKQKSLLQEKFGVYFIAQAADSHQLKNLNISQSYDNIALSAVGKTSNIFTFLESLQTQPHLTFHSLSLYPNHRTLSLELYLEISLYAKKENENS